MKTSLKEKNIIFKGDNFDYMRGTQKHITVDASMSSLKADGNTERERGANSISGRELRRQKVMDEADAKYAKAMELFTTTDMQCTEIAKECGISAGAFRSYLARRHRDLLMARHGIDAGGRDLRLVKIFPPKGQRPATYRKYKDAIEACDNMSYIEYNISQIARMFGLNGTQLANQLRVHYPDIPIFREKVRKRLGLADNVHHGVRPYCAKQYGDAVDMYLNTDKTVEQVADECGVSFRGLDQHLRFYHKDVINRKEQRRKKAKGSRKRGTLIGNGQIKMPRNGSEDKYSRAVLLADTTDMSLEEIAKKMGLNKNSLRYHLRTWHKDILVKRRCITTDGDAEDVDLGGAKHYLRSTASKYAPAIAWLKDNPDKAVAEAAAKYGFNPEVFRDYLKEHEPELAASRGMTRRANGKLVRRRSEEKYAAAIHEYATTTEPLKSIARRYGIVYNSIMGYVIRNCPDERERHNRLVAEMEARNADATGTADAETNTNDIITA